MHYTRITLDKNAPSIIKSNVAGGRRRPHFSTRGIRPVGYCTFDILHVDQFPAFAEQNTALSWPYASCNLPRHEDRMPVATSIRGIRVLARGGYEDAVFFASNIQRNSQLVSLRTPSLSGRSVGHRGGITAGDNARIFNSTHPGSAAVGGSSTNSGPHLRTPAAYPSSTCYGRSGLDLGRTNTEQSDYLPSTLISAQPCPPWSGASCNGG
jgi:hypothetical protein